MDDPLDERVADFTSLRPLIVATLRDLKEVAKTHEAAYVAMDRELALMQQRLEQLEKKITEAGKPEESNGNRMTIALVAMGGALVYALQTVVEFVKDLPR